MRIGFAGTPEFAALALEALINDGQTVPIVLTQPDRPSGRGMKLTPSAVKQMALAHGIRVIQPPGLRLDGRYSAEATDAQAMLSILDLDVLVVAAYGLILPEWVLKTPKHGCLNIHASLLPRWRGAAPIQRAIEAGDEFTGITIMQMDEGLDTGDALLTEIVAIDPCDTAQTLHDKLANSGASLIVQAIHALEAGALQAVAQRSEGITYANKILKAEATLDLTLPADVLARKIRAFNPFPGATIQLPGLSEPIKIWRASALPTVKTLPPGTLLDVSPEGVDLATGGGILRLLELQKPGGKRQPVASFVQGYTPPNGAQSSVCAHKS